jgi:hypothetical protein
VTKFNGGDQTFSRITLMPAKTFYKTWCTMVRDKKLVTIPLTVIKIIVTFGYGLQLIGNKPYSNNNNNNNNNNIIIIIIITCMSDCRWGLDW